MTDQARLEKVMANSAVISEAYRRTPTPQLLEQSKRMEKMAAEISARMGRPVPGEMRVAKPVNWTPPKWAAVDAWPEAAFRVWHYLEAGWVPEMGKGRTTPEHVAARAVGGAKYARSTPTVTGTVAVAMDKAKGGNRARLHWRAETLADVAAALEDHWPAVQAVANGLRGGSCATPSSTERTIFSALEADDKARIAAHRRRSSWALGRARA